jgi:hypothetical protein
MIAFNGFHEEPESSGQPRSTERESRPRESGGSTAREIARRLGGMLVPVVIDLGPDQPRFASYLQWDEQRGLPLLVPVAGEPLALAVAACSEPIRIRSTDAAEPWMLFARTLRVVSDRLAIVELGRAEAVRMPDRVPARVQARGREPLVLAVHPGAGAIEGHVFPLTSLGAEHCLIDATAPLERGQLLGPVEVIGERRILRRATARVIQVIPWVTAHSERRFRCRLAFEDPAAPAVLDHGHDLLSDSDRIVRLFELGSMIELAGWYDAPGWPRSKMRIGEVRDGLVTLLAAGLPPPAAIPMPVELRVGFELFAVSYEGWMRLHRRRGSRVEVALPFVMRRRRRRREQRASVAAELGVMLQFRSSATGELLRRPIRDVSFGGLCVEAEPADLLWRGACLEEARIEWPHGDVSIGDLEVRAVERTVGGAVLCHAANRGLMPSEHPALISLLASSYHPEAERHDGRDFRAMLEFYERAGLLGEFMVRNLRPVLPEATAVWRKLHDRESSVACTLLFRGPGHDPQAAFSGVRVWEKTWLAQHFGALASADRRATGTLQVAYVDFVMPQRDTHYMAFFVRAENARMNAFHQKFFDLTGTPESVSRVTVALWTLRASTPARPPDRADDDHVVRPLREEQELLVSRAAERVFGPMATAALSLVPHEFHLPDTSRRFARLDLERSRTASVITDGQTVKAALFKERTSPGVNLTWMLDAWWLLPVESFWTKDEASVAVAAAEIARTAPDRPEADKFLIVPEGTRTAPLEAAGFEKLLNAHLYVLNRSGLRRYYEYISDRYGELGVRVTSREARLARSVS